MKNKVIILILIFIIILNCNLKKLDDPEDIAKNQILQIKKILKKILAIPYEEKEIDGRFIVTQKKRIQYINKNKTKINIIHKDILCFNKLYKNNKWTDDLNIFIGIMYPYISFPKTSFYNNSIEIYNMIITNCNSINLEPWSIVILKKLKLDYYLDNPVPGEKWALNLNKSEKWKFYFQAAIVAEYLKYNQEEKAVALFKQLKNDRKINKNKNYIVYLNNIISVWK